MQAMQPEAQAPAPATAKEAAKAGKLPLLSLLTFSPMGNPLSELTPGQCALFFDYLLMSLHSQRREQAERNAALAKRVVLPASLSAAALALKGKEAEERARAEAAAQKAGGAKAERERQERKAKGEEGEEGSAAPGEWGGEGGALGIKFTSLLHRKNEEEKGGGEGALGPSFSSHFGQRAQPLSAAIGQLSPVIDDYARGDGAKEKKIVGGLHQSARADGYKPDDLMASLLLVIEDDAWSGGEGGAGSAKPHGGATRLAALVPQKLRASAQESASVRLASVREMLRYYFIAHPGDYHVALAAALGLAADEESDSSFLQERLAAMLANIGTFALAQRLLAELKKKKRMGVSNCLLKLGYRYDAKRKRLVLGKRACGKPGEAGGIVGLLLASARKGEGGS